MWIKQAKHICTIILFYFIIIKQRFKDVEIMKCWTSFTNNGKPSSSLAGHCLLWNKGLVHMVVEHCGWVYNRHLKICLSSLSLLVNCGFWPAVRTVLDWKGLSGLWSSACWYSVVSELQNRYVQAKTHRTSQYCEVSGVNGEWSNWGGLYFCAMWSAGLKCIATFFYVITNLCELTVSSFSDYQTGTWSSYSLHNNCISVIYFLIGWYVRIHFSLT